MNFGAALEAAKNRQRIARAGWNGAKMYVCFVPETVNGDGLRVGAYLAMMTASGVYQPGWLASQPDMLAEDWYAIPA